MKLSHLFWAYAFSVSLISCSTAPQVDHFNEESKLSKREMGIAGRAEYELERLKDPGTGLVPAGIKMRELAYASTLPKSSSRTAGISDQIFEPIGPRNVGGRTRAISYHIENPNILLAGAVSGGMWRSIDFGQSWQRATNYEDQSAVSCIMQDQRPGKSNVFYYGSGESIGNSASKSFSANFYGSGMYKSIDDGASWTQMPSTATAPQKRGDWSFIYNIAMDYSNTTEDEIYAATSKGIRRSVDGGDTWTLVLGGTTNADWSEIVVTSSGVCYAHISADGNQTGFWRSEDGINWVNITPADLAPNHERALISVAPNNENSVYYYVVTPNWGLSDVSFFKYTYVNGDGSGSGGTWSNRSQNLPPAQGYDLNTQGTYCMSMSVSPTNENMVYIGATNLFRNSSGFSSANGTRQLGGYDADGYSNFSWRTDNQHPDQQDLAFNPHNTNQLLASTDGGLSYTNDPESTKVIWTSLNNGYQTTQFYGLGIDHLEENEIVLSGYQDNGSWMTFTADTLTDWEYTNGGDGAYCAKEGGNNVYYFSSQYGSIRRMKISETGSISSRRYITPQNANSSFQFNHPFILDPADNNKMYLPNGDDLWRNYNLAGYDNGQRNWENIASVGSEITAVGASKSDPGVVYVGASGRKVYKIIDDGSSTATVINVSNGITSGSYASNIEVDPHNSDNVIVVYSNYNVISIWSTTDGGATWESIEGNLKGDPDPGVPPNLYYRGNGPSLRWAKFIKAEGGDALLLGTSVGLFATNYIDGENTVWVQQASDVIGNVVIEQINYRESDGFCVVATHGAGAYKTYFENNWDLTSVENIEANDVDMKVYPNPTVATAELSFENAGNENVRVNVLNALGKVVEIQHLQTTAGQNTVSLDLTAYSEGMYFVTIITKDGSYTKAVLKQ